MYQLRVLILLIIFWIVHNRIHAAIFNIADGDVADLIAAIEIANTNNEDDIINLAPGGLYSISSAHSFVEEAGGEQGFVGLAPIEVGTTLVIEGNGATLRRAEAAGVFRLMYMFRESSLTLNNLILEDGLTNTRGGGAVLTGYNSYFEANGCTFTNNKTIATSFAFGGAVSIHARSTALIENCRFERNEATKLGGAIYNVVSNLTIRNCRFIDNKTTHEINGGGGAGVYVDGGFIPANAGTIEVTDCLFEGNETYDQGGGLYIYTYNNNRTTVSNCTFRENKAQFGAGFMYANGAHTGFANNTILDLSNSLFYKNHTTGQGGGLYLGWEGVGKVYNCTLVENTSEKYGGGMRSGSNIDIINCTIVKNFATLAAGGIYTSDDNNIRLYNSIVALNRSNNLSGIFLNCVRTVQGSNNIEYQDIIIHPNARYCVGGINITDPMLGPLQDNGGPTLTMALLPGSPAIDAGTSGAAIPGFDQRGVATEGTARDIGAFEYSVVGVVVNTPGNVNAIALGQNTVNLDWSDNSTNETGFTIQRSKNNIFNFETIEVSLPNTGAFQDTGLEPNTTYYYRIRSEGGVSTEWSEVAGTTTFTDGACTHTTYKPEVMHNPTAVIGSGTPASCTEQAVQSALRTGGNIMCNCGPNPVTIALTSALEVSVSGTVLDGGGLVALDANNLTRVMRVHEGIDFTLQNIAVAHGKAPGSGGLLNESGGGILIGSGMTGSGGGEIRIINSTFENNTVTNINEAERGGGAIYGYVLKNLIISGCSFTGNTANVGGAVAGLGSQVTIVNSTFENNEAAGTEAFLSGVGGAIYLDGIALWDSGNTETHRFSVCGSTFQNNRAKHEGGAIYCVVSDSRKNQTLIDKCNFTNNRLMSTSAGNGGAVFYVEDDYVGNTDDPALNFSVTNSIFEGNSCQRQGGALWMIVGGGGIIENTTLRGNSVWQNGGSLGGAVAISSAGYGGDFTMNNCTIAENHSAHFGGGIFASGDNDLEITNTIFYNNTSDFEWEGHQLAGAAAMTGAANIQFPETRWNGTADDIIPGRVSTDDPLLNPLGNNGGFTKTMALQEGSEAIDHVDVRNPAILDQRGLAPVGTRDIGAYEYGAVFDEAPVIVSFSPAGGGLGSVITITGTGFTGTTAVSFNFVYSTGFTVIDAQTIEATVPELATTGKIGVTNAFGTGYSTDDFLVVIPLPVITGITPAEGTSGTPVTITGTDFTGTTEVLFEDALAAFTVIDNTTIEAFVPSNATTGKIRVTTGGGTAVSADDFTVTPGIISFTPLLGGIGTEVVLNGTNLTGTTSVRFNGTEAASFTIENSTAIRAEVAAGTPIGAAPVAITAGDGNEYDSTDDFTVLPVPVFNDPAFTPASGTEGTIVTISGNNFTHTSSVQFNGAEALSFVVVDDDTLEVIVPTDATSGLLTVTTPGGTISTAGLSVENFTVLPSIEYFSPITGGIGTVVNIYGTNLTGVTGVEFGGSSVASFRELRSTVLTATIGTGATGVATVQTAEGTAVSLDEFIFVPPPSIDSLKPDIGARGTHVVLTGSNFVGVTEVHINGIDIVNFNVNADSTQVSFDVPDHVTTGPVTIVAAGGTVHTATDFTVLPTVDSFTPTEGALGTTVTLKGANFTGATAIKFFDDIGAPSFQVVNSTTATAVAGTGTTTGPIEITVGGQTAASANNFVFIPAPAITNVNPTEGLVGAVITITGTNFRTGNTSVTFDGVNAPVVNVLSATTLTVVVPGGATTGVLELTTDGGVATDTFTVTLPPPEITSFVATRGQQLASVSINGNNFDTTTEVLFNGVTADFTVNDDHHITARVPVGATTGKISITTPYGTAISAANFTVLPTPAPVLTGFTPESGVVGTTVEIEGDNLTGASEVQFNGVSASFTINNDHKITATVPVTTTGVIGVTTPGGTVNSADRFTVPFSWNGSTSTSWNHAANWTPAVVPNSEEADIVIPGGMANNPATDVNTFTVRHIAVESGATLTVSQGGILNIEGKIENEGSYISEGTTAFTGTTTQEIPAGIAAFNNLTIENPGDVTLLGNIDVTGALDMVRGNLYLNGKIIDLGTRGELLNETETSRVKGTTGSVIAVRTGGTGFLNTGMDVANLGAEITIPTATGLAGITIQRGHSRRGDVNKGIERYYVISPAGAKENLNATFVFNYFESELAGIPESELVLYRYDGVNWNPREASTRNATRNKVTLEHISQFSPWTAGVLSLPLPVHSLSLEAKRTTGDNVELYWSTRHEKPHKGFEVQRSSNAIDFETIARVDGKGTSQEWHHYRFTDFGVEDACYYRLKMENDEEEFLSQLVFVEAEEEKERLTVYPNPTGASIRIQANQRKKAWLELLTNEGERLFTAQGILEEIQKSLNEHLEKLPKGLYILKMKRNHRMYSTKVIKQ